MKARKDYVRLNRKGKRFFFEGFIAQVLPISDRVGMVGITATKKLGGSVSRHRAKRRLREVIRLWDKINSPSFEYDIVLIARSKIFDLNFTSLYKQWVEMLEKLEKNQDWTHETIRH